MTSSARTEALREQLRQLRQGPPNGIDLKPSSAYEVVTRQMVEDLAGDLKEIKDRLNGLLWMVAGTILTEVVMKLVAAGR